MERLEDFHEAVSDTAGYIGKLKERGKKVLGYFCSYTPEEIILAAGIHPVRLFSTADNITLADAHLQSYSCSLARGALEDALSGKLDFLDGTVFPHTCDTMQRLSDLWRLNTKIGFFADVVLPVKLNTVSAREYMEAVLRKFRADLEKGMGVSITDSALKESIEKYNTIRGCLRTIYELRSADPVIPAGSDLHAIVKGSMIMDRDCLLKRLPEVIESLRNKRSAANNAGKRIVLAGSICDHPGIHTIIEKSGGVAVWDDLCSGSRYFEGLIATEGDPVAAIADRYIKRRICPAKHVSNTAGGENIIEIVRSNNALGVVFILLKFCDPHDFDYPCMKASLEEVGIPSMLLEIEDQLPSEGQLMTRLETFIHTL